MHGTINFIKRNLIWIDLMIFINISISILEHSSFRNKRDLEELLGEAKDGLSRSLDVINQQMGGSFGVGDVCGAGGVKDHDQCSEISECRCEQLVCKCVLAWWFILSIVLLVLFVLGIILCCVLKALGCCECC